MTTISGRARLYRNVAAPTRGQWLKVCVTDPKLGRDAYGSEVTVVAEAAGSFGSSPAESYLSSGPPILHFGLGTADRVSHIEVKWPDGLSEEFGAVASNSTLHLQCGTGRPSDGK